MLVAVVNYYYQISSEDKECFTDMDLISEFDRSSKLIIRNNCLVFMLFTRIPF
jgi:hypothetical protein